MTVPANDATDGGRQPWLPSEFRHPERVDLDTGAHLRPIRADDAQIHYPAVMGSRGRLWKKYGDAWGWPPATMTLEPDREDLDHREQEILAHESFNYAILDREESRLLGCIYLDPPGEDRDHDVVVSWWVIDDCVGTPLEAELEEFVPRWVTSSWPFSQPRYAP